MMEQKYNEEEKSNAGVKSSNNSSKLNTILRKRENGDVIANLYPYYQSKIRYGLEEFCERYASEFDPEDDENKLSYWDVFKKFEILFEGYLEEFIIDQQLNKKEFYADLEEACNNPEGKSHILVKLVVAQTDYEFFVKIMKDKAREEEHSGTKSKHK